MFFIFTYTCIKLVKNSDNKISSVHKRTSDIFCQYSSFPTTVSISILVFLYLYLIYIISSSFLASFFHLFSFFSFLLITNLEGYLKNCPAISWNVWTGNELTLNLAATLNQAKVIKRHMNCDVSEQWTDPCETKGVNTKNWSCWIYIVLK